MIAQIEDRDARETRCAQGLRSFAATPHVVFYRVVNDAPDVVRLLDGRQDVEERFAARDGD